jgi:hypothetical protein
MFKAPRAPGGTFITMGGRAAAESNSPHAAAQQRSSPIIKRLPTGSVLRNPSFPFRFSLTSRTTVLLPPMSGKIALPSTPKLESQSFLSGEHEPRAVVTRHLLKGAALGAAAWFIVTSALNAGPVWVSSLLHLSLLLLTVYLQDRDGFASWGWGKHSHPHGHGRPTDCSVWDDFDFEAPLKFGEGRHPHRHPRHPTPPDMPHPPQSPDMPRPPTPPGAPHALPPHFPHPPSHHHDPNVPHPHESQVFNISSSASEIRLASMGFLGHGVLRVESAPEGVDFVQVEVRGAHEKVCLLKGEDKEVVGVGLVVCLNFVGSLQ